MTDLSHKASASPRKGRKDHPRQSNNQPRAHDQNARREGGQVSEKTYLRLCEAANQAEPGEPRALALERVRNSLRDGGRKDRVALFESLIKKERSSPGATRPVGLPELQPRGSSPKPQPEAAAKPEQPATVEQPRRDQRGRGSRDRGDSRGQRKPRGERPQRPRRSHSERDRHHGSNLRTLGDLYDHQERKGKPLKAWRPPVPVAPLEALPAKVQRRIDGARDPSMVLSHISERPWCRDGREADGDGAERRIASPEELAAAV